MLRLQKKLIRLALFLMLCHVSLALLAVQVTPGKESSYFSKSRIKPFDSQFLGKGVLCDGMDIRRVEGHHDKPEAQIAIWMPLIEPEPIVKTQGNEITDATLIYRNIGPTKDKFPYVIKEKSTGKFYIYRNVKYYWAFEQPDDKKKVLAEGNKGGVSGGEVYSPFLNIRAANKEFFEDLVNGNASEGDVWDKKMFVNRHTTAFDSGIAGNKDVAGSTILQQVGMIMTYERAEVTGLTPSGTGYPAKSKDTADPAGELPGTVNLTQIPDDSEFEKFGPEKTIKPVPEDLKDSWNLSITIDGKEYHQFTEYNVVYVEDYSYPEISEDFLNPQGSIYYGVVGKYLEKEIKTNYVEENADLLPTSPAVSSAFDYYFSLDELYHMANPFYDGSPSQMPVWFFYFLKSNGTYGPYVGVCDPDLEKDYYIDHHPYWKDHWQNEKEKFDKFMADRLTNSWKANFLAPWEKGLVIYVLYGSGDGETRVNNLNEAWKTRDLSKLVELEVIEDELNGLNTPEAQEGKQAIQALKTFITTSSEGDRSTTRFAHIGFSADTGRCGISKITLENIPSQHEEKKVMITDPATGQSIEVKKGSWTIGGKRFILPRHFAMNSIEWNDHCPPPPDTTKIQDNTKKTQEMIKYYQNLRSQPPDCLMTQEVSNCCGNAAPAGSLIKIEDVAEFSKPLIDCEIENMANGTIHKIGVPPIESLDYGSQLAARDVKTGTITNYGTEGVNEDFDMATKDWFIIKQDGTKEDLPKLPSDPEGPEKNNIPVEDQRMKFVIKPYDNIDSLTPFRGVIRTEVEIEALDENQNPTGKLEQIEYEKDGQIIADTKVVKDGTGLDRYELYNFDPTVQFYHIFRAAGWYQFRVKAYDRAKNGSVGQSREMKFNINVLPIGFNVRTIDGR